MSKPPPAPPSSDIGGVDRDSPKVAAEAGKHDPDQQRKLADVTRENTARPPRDPDLEQDGNPQ